MPNAAERPIVVLDASIVVALVATPSTRLDELADRLGGATLHAPDLLPAEVDSALRALVLGGRLTPAQGAAARAVAHGLPIDLWPWALVSERVWELRENLSAYDAGYVALAERIDGALLTRDARVWRAGVARCPIEVID